LSAAPIRCKVSREASPLEWPAPPLRRPPRRFDVVGADPLRAVIRSGVIGVSSSSILDSSVSPRGTCADPRRRRAAGVVGLAGAEGPRLEDGGPGGAWTDPTPLVFINTNDPRDVARVISQIAAWPGGHYSP